MINVCYKNIKIFITASFASFLINIKHVIKNELKLLEFSPDHIFIKLYFHGIFIFH